MANTNPWLGLKTYSEGQMLYGRTEEIQNLSQDIIYNRQTIVYGKSGIGKSSLLNAGVFPLLRRAHLFPVSIRLSHSENDISYLEQIRRQVENSINSLRKDVMLEDCSHTTKTGVHGAIESVCERRCPDIEESLWEYFHRHAFYDDEHNQIYPALVFDQFEEIFTLCRDERKKVAFFEQLAQLINDNPPDYIYGGAIDTGESVNDLAQTDDPDELVIAEEDDDIEHAYLQEPKFHVVITLREDFLAFLERYTVKIPLLKHNHYCLQPLSLIQARTIIVDPRPGLIDDVVADKIISKVTATDADKSVVSVEVDSAILSLFLSELYERKGDERQSITSDLVNQAGDNIINDFYERSIAEISAESAAFLEDNLVTDDGRRDSMFESRARKAGVRSDELALLKDKRLLHEFPGNNDGIRIEFMHDVLCSVILERRNRRRQEEELRQRQIEAEKAVEQERLKRLEVEQKAERERRRNRRRMRLIVIGVVLTLVVGYLYAYLWWIPYSEVYSSFTTVYGWPEGVGQEINDGKTHRNMLVCYRLSRRGRLSEKHFGSHFNKVEVIDADGHPAANVFMGLPIVDLLESEMLDVRAAAFADMEKRTAYWVFSSTDLDNSRVSTQTAYDADNNKLYSINYSHDSNIEDVAQGPDDVNKYVRWAVFVNPDGSPLQVRDNGADRMRQNMKNGRIVGCQFFTMLGSPQANGHGVYGYAFDIDDDGALKVVTSLDRFGSPISSTICRLGISDRGRSATIGDVEMSQAGNKVYYRTKMYTDSIVYDNNGNVVCGCRHFAGNEIDKVEFRHDEKERPLFRKLYDEDGNLLYYRVFDYNGRSDDRPISIEAFDGDDAPYIIKYNYVDTATVEESYWRNNRPIMYTRQSTYGYPMSVHKCKTTTARKDSIMVYTVEYTDTLGCPVRKDGMINPYCKSIQSYKDAKLQVVYMFDTNDEIAKSECYFYDDFGNCRATATAGVDGTPVRAPSWSRNLISCYIMSICSPLLDIDDQTLVSAGGVDEFGERDNMTCTLDGKHCFVKIADAPLSYNFNYGEFKECNYVTTGVSLARTIYEPLIYKHPVNYVHLLSRRGTFYRAGVKDNDIILSINGVSQYPTPNGIESALRSLEKNGGHISVLRAVPSEKRYCRHDFDIPGGNAKVEFVLCELTDHQLEYVNKSLKK